MLEVSMQKEPPYCQVRFQTLHLSTKEMYRKSFQKSIPNLTYSGYTFRSSWTILEKTFVLHVWKLSGKIALKVYPALVSQFKAFSTNRVIFKSLTILTRSAITNESQFFSFFLRLRKIIHMSFSLFTYVVATGLRWQTFGCRVFAACRHGKLDLCESCSFYTVSF